MTSHGKIFIGTSGWSYPHWVGPFYPQELETSDQLGYYSSQFQTVEINHTFYQLPDETTLSAWRAVVPQDFCFAVKASRYITHMKKLIDPQESAVKFLERIAGLGEHLGPVLFQLPPHWRPNADRLEAFLQVLPDDFRYTFEFRDDRWFEQDIYRILRAHQAAFCIYDLAGRTAPRQVTADFVYLRLHGPDEAYQGRYSVQALAGWAGAISTWSRQGKPVYCYFDNDQHGYAPENAARLQAMCA